MALTAIRGATTIERDDEAAIAERSVELVKEIVAANKLVSDNVVSVTISTTADITAGYPAKAVRKSGLVDAPLFSCLEPPIKGALPLCIRFMVLVEGMTKKHAKHIYLHGAEVLRPDLANN